MSILTHPLFLYPILWSFSLIFSPSLSSCNQSTSLSILHCFFHSFFHLFLQFSPYRSIDFCRLCTHVLNWVWWLMNNVAIIMVWSAYQYHCVHGTSCLCTLSASAFIEPSLYTLAIFLLEWIVRLLVATLHVGMTGKQDGGYTQLAWLQREYLWRVKISFTNQ